MRPDGLTARGWRIAAADVAETEKRALRNAPPSPAMQTRLARAYRRLLRIEARARREAGRG